VGELLKLFPYWSLEVIMLKSPYKDPTITERRVAALHKAGVPWRWPTDKREALGPRGVGAGISLALYGRRHAQARRSFAQAMALDPQYARPMPSWVGTYLHEWIFQWSEDPLSLERAFDLAQEAIALDASLPLVHRVLGHVYL